MRKPFRVICSLLWRSLLCCLIATDASADQLHLKDGRVVEADIIWETDGMVWYRQGKLIASFPRAEVQQIVAAARTESPVVASSPAAGIAQRIRLTDGTEIVADEVYEGERFIRYRLGTIQTLIDRDAVAAIVRAGGREVPPPAPQPDLRFTTSNPRLDELILRSAEKHQLDPLIIYLVMREESRFNHRAVSRAGARGLMQLLPATARRLGVRNIHDPVENVEAGTKYLKSLIELYEGDVNLALAAYNAGEQAVAKYGRRIPPYRETLNYVRRINVAYRKARAVTKDER